MWPLHLRDLLLICPSVSSTFPHTRFGVRKRGDYNTTIMNTPQVSKSRRQMLEEFVAKNPADAFGRYGLAMECLKTGDSAAAEDNFKQLIAAHADYVAAYFQYGQMLAKMGRVDDARETLTEGVTQATKTGEEHARSELQAALDELR